MARIPASHESELHEVLVVAARVAFPIPVPEALIARLEVGK